ncbi:hypothetical protein ACRALDRAFT_2096058 [Sodiomyces alcalophilus JCM 7366]|uniref:uncharacterized protein n=1 Tax=Sodiomyces alcalophilus JCM 7366 TaxID=591952 RepID=UPI0039B6CED1
MSDHASTSILPGPGHKLKPSSKRQYRLSSEHSPTRTRIHDDLLSHLTPMSSVDILQYPTPSLKACLDASTANEQEFAMRTAVASQKIYEWLDEISEWPWPAIGGAAGFETPVARKLKLSLKRHDPEPVDGDQDQEYSGCLPTRDVMQYKRRLDEISQGLEELEVDEIKTHILHNHILPLSRPGTPMSDCNRSVVSLSAYNHLDDLTAVITAIIVQALPNLARITRLLSVWQIRLDVLQGIPSLLSALSDAEVALQSGWNVISAPAKRHSIAVTGGPGASGHPGTPAALTEKDFAVMKAVLQKTIATAARIMDAMLDSLEGVPDTLPDSWVTRMDNLEHGYAAWHAACEAKIRGTVWLTTAQIEEVKKTRPIAPVPISIAPPAEDTAEGQSDGAPLPKTPVRNRELGTDTDTDAVVESGAHTRTHSLSIPAPSESRPAHSRLHTPVSFHRGEASASEDMDPVKGHVPAPAVVTDSDADPPIQPGSSPVDDFDDDSPHSGADSDDEPELPPLIHGSRRFSGSSYSSTVIHGQTSPIATSDMPEISASPPLPRDKFDPTRAAGVSLLPRLRIALGQDEVEAEPELARRKNDSEMGSPASPGSSPPTSFRFREDSAHPPDDSALEADDLTFNSLLDPPSFIEEDLGESSTILEGSSMMEGSSMVSDMDGDDQFQQQISHVLDSIPANIKLAASPAKVNLNPPPPDLPALRIKKGPKEPARRSASGLSSRSSTRASTPAFLLAPAYGRSRRPRRKGQQETKVYHLSRTTGEAPIKLLIRCVGEHGERVMVRVGGGWADLGEYLKEYASHHGRRSANLDSAKIEVRDLPRVANSGRAATASPPARPASALDRSPMTPLNVRKTRRSFGTTGPGEDSALAGTSALRPSAFPRTPAWPQPRHDGKGNEAPLSDEQGRSMSSSRISWGEDDDSLLGLAGPTGRKVEMSEESRAWVESVKEKVRLASGERKPEEARFGELGRVGATKRLFRKS